MNLRLKALAECLLLAVLLAAITLVAWVLAPDPAARPSILFGGMLLAATTALFAVFLTLVHLLGDRKVGRR